MDKNPQIEKKDINQKEKIEYAQKAFSSKDETLAKIVHDKQIEEHNNESGKYLKSIVYGGLDGIITTFAVVAGVAGAGLSPKVIMILGFANLFADGLSMSMGDYLSTKSEQEYNKLERKREAWEMETYPEGEIKEMIELYTSKGMSKEDANIVVPTMAKYKDLFVDVMMVEELGILEDYDSPIKNALATFFSFSFFGFIPLVATILASFIPIFNDNNFLISSIMTGTTLFILGAMKSKFTGANFVKSGLEMLFLGGSAAFAAWLIGVLLGNI